MLSGRPLPELPHRAVLGRACAAAATGAEIPQRRSPEGRRHRQPRLVRSLHSRTALHYRRLHTLPQLSREGAAPLRRLLVENHREVPRWLIQPRRRRASPSRGLLPREVP